jgi:hypothetical protein
MELKDKIKSRLDKWQDILRLRDWDITVNIVQTKWRKSGDIKIDLSDRKAVLLVNEKGIYTNLDELVVHELLHLKLYELDQLVEEQLEIIFGTDDTDPKRQFAYNQFMKVLESTVEDLTKGYLSISGSTEPLSFGRLQVQIDDELKQ